MSTAIEYGAEVIVALPFRPKRRAVYRGQSSRTGMARVQYWVEHLDRPALWLVYVSPTFVHPTPPIREGDVRQWGPTDG